METHQQREERVMKKSIEDLIEQKKDPSYARAVIAFVAQDNAVYWIDYYNERLKNAD